MLNTLLDIDEGHIFHYFSKHMSANKIKVCEALKLFDFTEDKLNIRVAWSWGVNKVVARISRIVLLLTKKLS